METREEWRIRVRAELDRFRQEDKRGYCDVRYPFTHSRGWCELQQPDGTCGNCGVDKVPIPEWLLDQLEAEEFECS